MKVLHVEGVGEGGQRAGQGGGVRQLDGSGRQRALEHQHGRYAESDAC